MLKSYPPEVVRQIYGGISQNNLCFVIEVNSEIIGECWLLDKHTDSMLI